MAQQKTQSDEFRAVQKVSGCTEIIEQAKTLVRNNHSTLREVLRTLAIMGVLQTRQGSGTQVADSSKDILKTPFRFLLVLNQLSISKIYETRKLIKVFLSGQAAKWRTSEDLFHIEQALHDMRDNVVNRAAMNEAQCSLP